jgi:hypothetical protein
MPIATDQQVQQYVNERVRPRCEQVRALLIAIKDDKASIDDVYAATGEGSMWTDVRNDGPPHLLVPSDVRAYNAFISGLIAYMEASPDYPIVAKACVRPAAIVQG